MFFADGSIPNCVPEYYRERQERLEHEYELMEQRHEYYQANRQKLKEAARSGLPILDYGGYAPCWECTNADHDTMAFDDDDFSRVICHDPSCPEHKKHQAGEETNV